MNNFADLPRQSPLLGAACDSTGTDFVLFSAHAQGVELCLFDAAGEREGERLPLERTGDVWHRRVERIGAGQRYGYRVYGPYEPWNGHRFNPNKLLIDPYAKALDRPFRLAESHFGYRLEDSGAEVIDQQDSAPDTPKCILVSGEPAATPALHTPWRDTVIYELHVRGMTMRRSDIAPSLRGTLGALAAPAIIAHLQELGVTAIELLPVHAIADEPRLVRMGLRNYWGYNPINYFALEPRYALGDTIGEFRSFLARLHEAGIEVILDVVFNHTGEGDARGPTISFRGIDNASYYMLSPGDFREYVNISGTGNTLNVAHPRVREMVLDALRHWARLGVDGFRFDLAATLGRDAGAFRSDSPLLTALASDPEISRLKLIAEPWDATPEGYRLGFFPPPFAEWNDRYRDGVRHFWRADAAGVGEVAQRIAGSSDLMGARGPLASVNFVTSHDGFTLQDLVSYAEKHNWANGEANIDGTAENYSWNCGAEGPSDDAAIRDMRFKQKRNLIATLFFSLGVPMLAAGDELGRSQAGNNNAYCQDNKISWIDWDIGPEDEVFLSFVQRVLRLRRSIPALRRDTFYRGMAEGARNLKDILWLRPDGSEMGVPDWENPGLRTFACAFGGTKEDPRYLLAFNAGATDVSFVLPENEVRTWKLLLDTSAPDGGTQSEIPAGAWRLSAHTLSLFEEITR
jgi:glycogen operon protein